MMRYIVVLLLVTSAAAVPGKQNRKLQNLLRDVYDLIYDLQKLQVIKTSATIMSNRLDACVRDRENSHDRVKEEAERAKLKHILEDTHELMAGLYTIQVIKDSGAALTQILDSCTAAYSFNDPFLPGFGIEVQLPEMVVQMQSLNSEVANGTDAGAANVKAERQGYYQLVE